MDFGIGEDIFYIINEYILKGTLRQRHPIGTRVPLTTVTSYVKQVADALEYVHDRGIVHSDVKPENMFIRSGNQVVLGDFGIATILSDDQTVPAGTFKYTAPEQINGKPQLASDQYALGIVVYEWLSGEPPFSGSGLEFTFKQLTELPTSLNTIFEGNSAEVNEVVMRALRKDPQDRYPGMSR